MAGLADGFSVRPVAPDELLDRARAVLTESGKEGGNGARRRPKTADGLGPVTNAGQEFAQGGHTPKGGPHLGRPAAGFKPLKANPMASAPKASAPPRPPGDATALLAQLSAGIDDLFEADLSTALASAPRTHHGAGGRSGVRRHPDRRSAAAPIGVRPPRGVAVALRAGRGGRLLRDPRHLAGRDDGRGPAGARSHRARAGAGRDRSGAGRRAGPKLEAIREVVGEALRVLGDKLLRPRYQNHLP